MNLEALQHPDGHWEGEVVWNTMLLSQYVITCRLLDHDLPLADVRRHYERTRRPDGSWPFHVDADEGSLYVTVLAYVALRLTGTPADDPLVARARAWMHARPHGVAGVSQWGRMWLAMLGLFPYDRINPVPPELVLTPLVRRLYCHTRYVYLGLAWLSGSRFRRDLMPELAAELRVENPRRHVVDPGDLFERPSWLLRRLYDVANILPTVGPVRRRALDRCAQVLTVEQAESRGQGLSTVNSLLACLVLNRSPAPLDVWKWSDENGLRLAGARSASWDTAFAMRALLAGDGLGESLGEPLRRAHEWLLEAQETGELADPWRDSVRGGWCFSDGTHRWPVSDCTAEALSALLLCDAAIGTVTPPDRVADAVAFILSRQNPDGGFGTYERTRAPRWVENLNPSEMYTDCMTDISHVECTASCVSALVRARRFVGGLDRAIDRGVAFLRSRQRPDGSYRGAWGINFTYAAFFVVEALTEAGVPVDDPAVAGVASWLVRHQRSDGGWGEHHQSARTGSYVPHAAGQRTQTAWAMLALARALGSDHSAVLRGAEFLRGDHAVPEAATGVFFGTAVLDYSLYKAIFPEWAANVVEGFTRQPS